MGLLDGIGGKLAAALSGGQGSDIVALISGVLGQTDVGGLQGIVTKLAASGLGPQVSSWLGNSANLPITADQLRAALSDEHVQQIARHFNLPVDQALQLLAQHLPAAVDHASPNGTLPQGA
jgi:uncharacterized protein YidB (DUF937 family)